jgi:type I restriction enzyme M protein
MGKTNPLNDDDLKEFAELQETKPETEHAWTVDITGVPADTWDLSVKNPNAPEEVPLRSPQEILEEMERLDKETNLLLQSVKELL